MKKKIVQAVILGIFCFCISGAAISVSIQKATHTIYDIISYDMLKDQACQQIIYLCAKNVKAEHVENDIRFVIVSNRTEEEDRRGAEYQDAKEKFRRQLKREAASEASSTGASDSAITIGFVTGEAGTSPRVVQRANQIWDQQIPQNIKDRLIKYGWSIVVSKQDLADRFGYSGSIAGITEFESKTIYLDNRESAVTRSLVHEVGHAVDTIACTPSDSHYFAELMAEETPYCPDGDNRNSAQECFANVFQYIIQYGDSYASYSPKMYEYVKKFM